MALDHNVGMEFAPLAKPDICSNNAIWADLDISTQNSVWVNN